MWIKPTVTLGIYNTRKDDDPVNRLSYLENIENVRAIAKDAYIIGQEEVAKECRDPLLERKYSVDTLRGLFDVFGITFVGVGLIHMVMAYFKKTKEIKNG